MVRRFSKAVIKEALERELERGGQVFFVHNRVQSLLSMTRFIQELVPDARVIMGHGQMNERELEATMVRFVSGQADILVSTAIVESGLDIPTSNTIIINRADRFGLAQLYQLRGRVGRERLQGYCYLLVPADGRVDDQAQRRLRALQELTELGSGFKLALRDLEIRGAGNLLGAQQHGHIAAVGYDLYSKLLAEAVQELKGDRTGVVVEPVISVQVEGFLPEEYVPEVNQRLAFYKRLAGVAGDEELADLRAELADRFGPLPEPAEQLLDIVRIRVAARAIGVERVEAGEGKAVITFAPSTPIDPARLVGAIQASRGRLRLRREFTLEAAIATGRVARRARLAARHAGRVRRSHDAPPAGPVRDCPAAVRLRHARSMPAMPGWVAVVGKKTPAAAAPPPPSSAPAVRPVETAQPGNVRMRPFAETDDAVSDRVIAVVNNDAITLAELQESVVPGQARPDSSSVTSPTTRWLQDSLNQLIERPAAAPGSGPGEDHRRGGRGRRGVERAHQALRHEATRTAVRGGPPGAGHDGGRRSRSACANRLKVQKLVRRKVTLRVSVTDQEITQYLEQNRAKLERGCLPRPQHPHCSRRRTAVGPAWEAARIRADVLRQQIVPGADFAEMASQHSRDASAKDGGDLGTLKRGELAVDIESEILMLGPEEVSQPYRSPLGYHLFKLESKDTLDGDGLVENAVSRSATSSSARSTRRASTSGSRKSGSAPSSRSACDAEGVDKGRGDETMSVEVAAAPTS